MMTGQSRLQGPDVLALAAFGVIAAGVTVIAVVESYSNLLAFALAFGLAGWRAAIAPGCVDSFIIMGELLLFVTLIRHWDRVPYVTGLAMAVWGFLISAAGNIWHAPHATVAEQAVSVIWPVTAVAGMAGGLMIIKRVAAAKTPALGVDSKSRVSRAVSPGLDQTPVPLPAPVAEPGSRPPVLACPPGRENTTPSRVRRADVSESAVSALLAQDMSYTDIAAKFGVSTKTIQRRMAKVNGSGT